MYCEYCGHKADHGSRYCAKCGYSLKLSSPTEKNSTIETLALSDSWWLRLLKVIYVALYLPLLLVAPLVWSSNAPSCSTYYPQNCHGSYVTAFWYSLLAIVVYIVVIRLIKVATLYVMLGEKQKLKSEIRKLF